MPSTFIATWALTGAALAHLLRPIVVNRALNADPPATAPPPVALEALTAGIFASLANCFTTHPELLAFSALAGLCVPLATLDLLTRKLPNSLVATAYLTVLPLLGLAAITSASPEHLLRALLSMLAALTVHGVLYALGAIGGGDLKLTGVLAAALGWNSWTSTWMGLALGWLLGGLTVLASHLTRRTTSATTVPLAPFLIAGTLTTLLTGP